MATSYSTSDIQEMIVPAVNAAWVELAPKFSTLFSRFPHVPASNGDGPEWEVEVAENANTGAFVSGGAIPAPGYSTDVFARLNWAN